MKNRRFIQCDVFTSTPTKGNALAVVVDAQGMSESQMKAFAAWTNLAETTFLLPPDDPAADYKLKIFTPTREMLFAGHPTLGSCAAWLKSGGQPKNADSIKQQCGIGIVEIDTTSEVPAFVAPPTSIETIDEKHLDDIIKALDINPEKIVRSAKLDNGPIWQVLELETAEQVLAVNAMAVRWPEFKSIGLIGPQSDEHECDYEVRMLATSSGMNEDPITGSLNSAIACWLDAQSRLNKNIVVSQGTCIDRLGRVYINLDPDRKGRILIGGQTHILIEGVVKL